jgi:general secretion pathway protein D
MTVFQEVSSVDYSRAASIGLITNKRSIESNVLVDDGSIIVLGGLLSDEFSGNASKVPGLGDIPAFGWLFKSETRTRSKKNLMVFLRPVVVRDAKASDTLSTNRYEQMLGLQRNAVPTYNPLLDTGPGPLMPPLAPPSQPSATTPAATSAVR